MNNLIQAVEDIIKRAEIERESEGQYYINEETGLKHCAVCGEAVQCRIDIGKLSPVSEGLSPAALKAVMDSREWFSGAILPAYKCKCVRDADSRREKRRAEEALAERRGVCYGRRRELGSVSWSNDDGRCAAVSEKLKRYAASFTEQRKRGHGLILHGERGRGKTYQALCITNSILERGYRAIFTSVYKIQTETSQFITPQQVINGYLDNDIIVLDGVDAECFMWKNQATFSAAVHSAEAAGIPLIITTDERGKNLEYIASICKNATVMPVKAG